MAGARKRLCILLPSHWGVGMGGAEMQVRMLVGRLLTLDCFDLHYVARRIDPTHSPEGYSLHLIPSYGAVSGTFLFDVPHLLRLLKRLQPDVIYQRVGCAYTGAAAYFSHRSQRRMVWHISSDRDLMPLAWRLSWRSPIEQLNKSMIEYGARRADAVIVQNSQQAALLHRYYGRSDAVHVPNFHVAPSAPMVKPADRVTVCWVGNIKSLKQADVFVRLAIDFQERPDVEFVMVGAPQMRQNEWERLLAKIRGSPNLNYRGPQPQAVVEELLARAHVLVNTSAYEGFPNTFIQSWLRAVPVISLCVNPDGVFDDDRYGICAEGSYERLRAALDRLVTDSILRSRIGERSSSFARERFSERNVDQIIRLLSREN